MTSTLNEGVPVEFGDYVRTLWRHWLVILLLTAIGAGAGYAAAKATPPTYRSQSNVFVYSKDGKSASELVQGSTFAQNVVQSYAALTTTPAVLTPAIKSLGLNMTAQDLAKSVTATVPLNTVIVQISVTGPSATEVAHRADAIAEALGKAVLKLSPKGAKGATTVTAEPVAPAPVPTHPFAPNSSLMIETGAGIGFAVAVCFALLRGAIGKLDPTNDDAGSRRRRRRRARKGEFEPAAAQETLRTSPEGSFADQADAAAGTRNDGNPDRSGTKKRTAVLVAKSGRRVAATAELDDAVVSPSVSPAGSESRH